MPELDVEQIIRLLNLQPLPGEGGLFRQTYRSAEEISAAMLPARYLEQAHGESSGETSGGTPDRKPHAPPRPCGTAIFYLLTSQTVEGTSPDAAEGQIVEGTLAKGKAALSSFSSFSAFHRLRSDEIFHFYLGDPLEMTLLYPDGASHQVILGQDIFQGQQLQFVVPHSVWQGARLVTGGRFALLGTTMSPGFTDADYEHGDRGALLAQYPHERERILAMTR